MMTEGVRIMADWLDHATYGINAFLPGIPRETGLAQPSNLTVLDSTRNSVVARGEVPPNTTAAALVTPADTPFNQRNPTSNPFPADLFVDVMVRFAVRNPNTENAWNATSVYTRAMWKSIRALMHTADGLTARTRSDVLLVSIDDMQGVNQFENRNDIVITTAIVFTLRLNDIHANS